MRTRALVVAVAILMGSAPSGAQTPSPTPKPVFELHRTHHAAAFPARSANPLFVLVVGSDIRQGDPAQGRADSLHVVALNTQSKQGTIIGIPRDALVDVPGYGQRKVNSALALGGLPLLVDTVARAGAIPIHYAAMVEFSRFQVLVDQLGGIEVDIPYPLADRLSGAYLNPGRQFLAGWGALAFARARHGVPGGDFGRSENQGRLLLAGLEKFVAEAASPAGMLKYLHAFRSLVVSTVPVRDLIHLATLGRKVDPAALRNIVLPGVPGMSGRQSAVFMGAEAGAVWNAVRDDGVL